MTRSELIEQMAKKMSIQSKQAEELVELIFDEMIRALLENRRIEIRGFGTLVNREYEGYTGRNPKTGELVRVAPKRVPFFKVGKELRTLVGESTAPLSDES